MSKQGGRGDRHRGTARSHNKTPKPSHVGPKKGMTKKQRALNLHGIHNRGKAAMSADAVDPVAASQAEPTTRDISSSLFVPTDETHR